MVGVCGWRQKADSCHAESCMLAKLQLKNHILQERLLLYDMFSKTI